MFRNLLGYALCIVVAFLLCENRQLYITNKRQNLRILCLGITLQLFVTVLLLYSNTTINTIKGVANFILRMSEASIEGTKFVFGYLGGGEPPFQTSPGSSTLILGLQSLPMVIFISAFFAMLSHLRIVSIITKILGYPFKRIFKISDATGTVAVSKVLLGQCEAPLIVRSYLDTLPKNEMFIILSLAFSTSSAAVMPVYAEILRTVSSNAIEYFIMANIINIITTLIICSIMLPKDYNIEIIDAPKINRPYSSMTEALNTGLSTGTATWIAIVGSLIGMVALISFVNTLLGYFPNVHGLPITLQRIISLFLAPIVWLLEIPVEELPSFAQTVGTRLVLNEVVSMAELAKHHLSELSNIKAIYMISNFGNLSVMGITVVGLSTLAPKSPHIKPLMGKAFIAGLISTVMTTCLISIFM